MPVGVALSCNFHYFTSSPTHLFAFLPSSLPAHSPSPSFLPPLPPLPLLSPLPSHFLSLLSAHSPSPSSTFPPLLSLLLYLPTTTLSSPLPLPLHHHLLILLSALPLLSPSPLILPLPPPLPCPPPPPFLPTSSPPFCLPVLAIQRWRMCLFRNTHYRCLVQK